ncbi:zinc knuckle protein, partial [Lasius niger]
MWQKICTIYERDNEQQKCSLLQTFYTLSFDKGADIASYVSKLKNIATRLEALNAKIDNDTIKSKILATLPASYKHFANAWESAAKKDLTSENLTARLIAEEMRNTKNLVEEKAVTFKATIKKCHKCHKTGHFARDCKMKNQPSNKEVRCFKCNKMGHMAKSCNDKRSNGEKFCNICKKNNHTDKDCFYRKKKESKEDDTDKVSFLANKMESSETWIVDSGSTSNMTNRRDCLKNFKEIKSAIGVAKINETMTAQGFIEFEN